MTGDFSDLDTYHDLVREATGSIDVAHDYKMAAYEEQLWATTAPKG